VAFAAAAAAASAAAAAIVVNAVSGVRLQVAAICAARAAHQARQLHNAPPQS